VSIIDPDYERLLKLLPRLNRFPDAIAETTLTSEEAGKIRALGFHAEAGRWKIPWIPFEVVRDGPFEWASHQTVAVDVQAQDSEAAIPRDTPGQDDVEQRQQASTIEGLPKLHQRMLRAVASQTTPGRYHLMPAQQYGPVEPVVKEAAQKIEQALRNGPVAKRLLQQRMGRYGYKAPIFHQALRYLADCGKIILERD
jgi:hypothetical protein